MKSSINLTHEKLQNFSDSYIQSYQEKYNELPNVAHDDDWQSSCIQSKKNDELDYWQPAVIEDKLSFENVEQALSITLHDDYKAYFTYLYSENLTAKCSEGELTLLLTWNQEDFERLQENIIGHIMMKRRLKQEITLFFAVTDHDDFLLSINNDTGAVFVEQVGCEPKKKLADSLADFIATLTPVV